MKLFILLSGVLLTSLVGFCQQRDTVEVIMLVCDTVLTRPVNKPVWRLDGPTEYDPNKKSYMYVRPPVYWLIGYSVRENDKHLFYLAGNKTVLPDKIVVWLSK